MEKFQNKYRIPSARLSNWDYATAALYFITICSRNRFEYFGNVLNGRMELNELGKIAAAEWLKTFDLRPDMNLYQGEFVVMPNHFHAIIGIGENEYNTQSRRDAMHCVSTTTATITDNHKPQNLFGPQSKNLASIVRGFKSSVTISARKINSGFAWQSRYHDHIIRNDESFQKIANYIINNPVKWQDDTFFNTAETV